MQKYVVFLVAISIYCQHACARQFSEENESDERSNIAIADEDVKTTEKPLQYDLDEASELFRRFVEDYNKKYSSEEDKKKHFENFVKNVVVINRLNAEGGTATFDINMFADLSDDEQDSFIG